MNSWYWFLLLILQLTQAEEILAQDDDSQYGSATNPNQQRTYPEWINEGAQHATVDTDQVSSIKKRNPIFSRWGGQRLSDLYFKRRPAFSSWGGKRGPAFSSWGGKRSTPLNKASLTNSDNSTNTFNGNVVNTLNHLRNDDLLNELDNNLYAFLRNKTLQHLTNINHASDSLEDNDINYNPLILENFKNGFNIPPHNPIIWNEKSINEYNKNEAEDNGKDDEYDNVNADINLENERVHIFDANSKRTLPSFNSWGGKRALALNKWIPAYNHWQGKKATAFSSWGGKRSPEFVTWGNEQYPAINHLEDGISAFTSFPENEIEDEDSDRQETLEQMTNAQREKRSIPFSHFEEKRTPTEEAEIKEYDHDYGEEKRSPAFNSWGGKRVPAFNSWGGKRAPAFNSWGGKRDPAFNSWGGKRDPAFNSWGGKRDPAFNSWGGKRALAFNSWGGKRAPAFNSWGGKRAPAFNSWGGKRAPAFNSWGGKRAPAFNSWRGKRAPAFNSWGGKRAPAFNSWGGKRAPAFNSWGGKRAPAFNSWGGKRAPAFNSWGGKRAPAFNSWGGKRAPAFNSWGGKRAPAFNSWGGKRAPAFNSWGGKRSSEKNSQDATRSKFETLDNIEPSTSDSSKRNYEESLDGKRTISYNRGSGKRLPAFHSWGGKRFKSLQELTPNEHNINSFTPDSNSNKLIYSTDYNRNNDDPLLKLLPTSEEEIDDYDENTKQPLQYTLDNPDNEFEEQFNKHHIFFNNNNNNKRLPAFHSWGGKRSLQKLTPNEHNINSLTSDSNPSNPIYSTDYSKDTDNPPLKLQPTSEEEIADDSDDDENTKQTLQYTLDNPDNEYRLEVPDQLKEHISFNNNNTNEEPEPANRLVKRSYRFTKEADTEETNPPFFGRENKQDKASNTNIDLRQHPIENDDNENKTELPHKFNVNHDLSMNTIEEEPEKVKHMVKRNSFNKDDAEEKRNPAFYSWGGKRQHMAGQTDHKHNRNKLNKMQMKVLDYIPSNNDDADLKIQKRFIYLERDPEIPSQYSKPNYESKRRPVFSSWGGKRSYSENDRQLDSNAGISPHIRNKRYVGSTAENAIELIMSDSDVTQNGIDSTTTDDMYSTIPTRITICCLKRAQYGDRNLFMQMLLRTKSFRDLSWPTIRPIRRGSDFYPWGGKRSL